MANIEGHSNHNHACTAGDDALSRFVNAAISFKPLYNVMKILAKRVVIQTAEKNGLDWKGKVRELQQTPEVRVWQILCLVSTNVQSIHLMDIQSSVLCINESTIYTSDGYQCTTQCWWGGCCNRTWYRLSVTIIICSAKFAMIRFNLCCPAAMNSTSMHDSVRQWVTPFNSPAKKCHLDSTIL